MLSHTTTIALTLNAVTPPNTPPTLAAIANQTVNVGQTVAFTASATDTDQPPQTLTFALLAGATNATLNTNSGAFSFRPLVTQANSTNNFTLKVSDNGTPALSATQSFSVIVNPLSAPGVSNISAAGGQFSFSVSGQSGPDYAIETSTNLTQWSNVFITNSPALPFNWTDTNSPLHRSDSTASNSARRCRKMPTLSESRWRIQTDGDRRRPPARHTITHTFLVHPARLCHKKPNFN